MDDALALQSQPLSDAQRDALGNLISQNLELYIQGLATAGNIFLLEGLRVNFPNASGHQSRPRDPDMPLGCPEAKYPSIPTKSSCVAVLFYGEAISRTADVLSRHRGNSSGLVVKDVSTTDMPAKITNLHLPNSFTVSQFPQYTYFIDTDRTAAAQPTSIVPILTECYQFGDLLQRRQLEARQ